jgi:biotin transporter BioY
MYYALPWLYPFTKIFFADLVILNIGLTILNIGYEVDNSARHTTAFVLMIVQIIVCRIAMCIYFKLRPVRHIEER